MALGLVALQDSASTVAILEQQLPPQNIRGYKGGPVQVTYLAFSNYNNKKLYYWCAQYLLTPPDSLETQWNGTISRRIRLWLRNGLALASSFPKMEELLVWMDGRTCPILSQ
jgi:hypothetical protein